MVDTRVVYLEPGKLTIERMTLPPLKPNQVLIQTHQASVCGSERYFCGITVRPQDEARRAETKLGDAKSHAYPMGPLGHEGGGVILEMGPASTSTWAAARCARATAGSLIYPTFSDYWVTDISNVQPIPEGVSFEVGCLYEPLGCAAWARSMRA